MVPNPVCAQQSQASLVQTPTFTPYSIPLGISTITGGAISNAVPTVTTTTVTNQNVYFTNSPGPGLTAATNTVIATNTVTQYPYLFVGRQNNVGLEVNFSVFNQATADASNLVMYVSQSIDGTNFSTTNNWTFTIPSNGTNQVTWCTNLTGIGTGWIGIQGFRWYETTAAQVITNLSVLSAVTRNK